jgi:hypothetical protein
MQAVQASQDMFSDWALQLRLHNILFSCILLCRGPERVSDICESSETTNSVTVRRLCILNNVRAPRMRTRFLRETKVS